MERREIPIHGQTMSVRTSGTGPVLLLIHGMAGSALTWRKVVPRLAERFTVVAPDLPGHGGSDKPPGDYSLGAFASSLRDLLIALGHERVSVVGHSLGGGVALQFAYQYPERTERLVLVSSGGLGREVSPLLRWLSLPASEAVLRLACAASVRAAIEEVAGGATRLGLRPSPVVEEIWRSYTSLGDDAARRAFLRTLRAVVGPRGQAVSATNRLHLAAELPTLVVWGEADAIIPVQHGHAAHEAIPGSRLEVFEGIGHYPQCEAPRRFVEVVADFLATTAPARLEVGPRHVIQATGARPAARPGLAPSSRGTPLSGSSA